MALLRLAGDGAGGDGTLGSKPRGQSELLVAGSLRDLIPDDHVLARVDRVLDLRRLRADVRGCYAAGGAGRPGIDPEVAVRLMLAGLLGIVHDRRLSRTRGIAWSAAPAATRATLGRTGQVRRPMDLRGRAAPRRLAAVAGCALAIAAGGISTVETSNRFSFLIVPLHVPVVQAAVP